MPGIFAAGIVTEGSNKGNSYQRTHQEQSKLEQRLGNYLENLVNTRSELPWSAVAIVLIQKYQQMCAELEPSSGEKMSVIENMVQETGLTEEKTDAFVRPQHHPQPWEISEAENKADDTVRQERHDQYGDHYQGHTNLGLAMTGIIQNHYRIELPWPIPARIAHLLMAAGKINRAAFNGSLEDNYVDGRVYLSLSQESAQKDEH